jgi:hypothetical protein
MKVQTDLRVGVALDEAWQSVQSAFATAGNTLSTAAQGIAQQAQALANNPGVQETVGTLKWWPFGPPKL